MGEEKYTTQNKTFSGADVVATCTISSPQNTGATNIYTLGSLETITISTHMERYPIRSLGNINPTDYVFGARTIAGTLIFVVFNKHTAYEAMQDLKKQYSPQCAFLPDELPPFDITISVANEYGIRSKMAIYGVRIVNEGQVMSTNDILTENTYQFVAMNYDILSPEGVSEIGTQSYKKIIMNSSGGESNSIENRKVVKQNNIILLSSIVNQLSANSFAVKFLLSPDQESGVISIKGNDNFSVDINIASMPNHVASITLAPGAYNAIYTNDCNEKSNMEYIVCAGNKSLTSMRSTSPTIVSVRPTGIDIRANVSAHNGYIIKNESTGDMTRGSINGSHADILNLTPETKYSIATYNNDAVSDSVIVTTPKTYTDKKECVRDMMLASIDSSDETLNDKYSKLIDSLCSISEKNQQSISDTCVQEISSLNDESQSIMNSYSGNAPSAIQQYLQDLREKISLCQNIIQAALKVENDSICSANNSTNLNYIYVNASNEIKTPFEAAKIEINADKNSRVIDGSEIKPDGNKYSMRYNFLPNVLYTIFCHSKDNIVSPPCKFYYSDEKNVYNSLNSREKFKEQIKVYIGKLERYMPSSFFSLSDLSINILAVYTMLKQSSCIIRSPKVELNNSNLSFTFDYNSYGELTGNNQAYFVFCDCDDLGSTQIVYRIPVQLNSKDPVLINPTDYNIKSDSLYFGWLEDSNRKIISYSSVFYTGNDSDIISGIEAARTVLHEYFANSIADSMLSVTKYSYPTEFMIINSVMNQQYSSVEVLASLINYLVEQRYLEKYPEESVYKSILTALYNSFDVEANLQRNENYRIEGGNLVIRSKFYNKFYKFSIKNINGYVIEPHIYSNTDDGCIIPMENELAFIIFGIDEDLNSKGEYVIYDSKNRNFM